MPTETCDVHETALICTVSGKLAGEYCPAEVCRQEVFVKNSANGESQMPTEVCDVHTGNGVLADILQNLQPGGNGTTGQSSGTSSSP